VNLKKRIGGDKIIVGGDDGLVTELQAKYGVEVQKAGAEFHFQMPSGAEFVPKIVADFTGRIRSIQVKQPSLEDVFLKLTGRAIRDQEGSALDSMRQNVALWRRGRR
jgi:ABC-2 type transport system ATP-binding protein